MCVEFIKKDLWGTDKKTGNKKRKSSKTKNELFREMLEECSSKIHFDYVLADSWFSSVENMICCKKTLKNDFIILDGFSFSGILTNLFFSLSRQNFQS